MKLIMFNVFNIYMIWGASGGAVVGVVFLLALRLEETSTLKVVIIVGAMCIGGAIGTYFWTPERPNYSAPLKPSGPPIERAVKKAIPEMAHIEDMSPYIYKQFLTSHIDLADGDTPSNASLIQLRRALEDRRQNNMNNGLAPWLRKWRYGFQTKVYLYLAGKQPSDCRASLLQNPLPMIDGFVDDLPYGVQNKYYKQKALQIIVPPDPPQHVADLENGQKHYDTLVLRPRIGLRHDNLSDKQICMKTYNIFHILNRLSDNDLQDFDAYVATL